MKLNIYGVVCVITMLTASGCSIFWGANLEETQNRMDQAREHIEAIKRLDMEDLSYHDDLSKAEELLANAEKHMKWGFRSKAMKAASESLEVSKRILRKFYLDTIAALAQKAKLELARKAEGDTDNPLTAYIPKLDEVADYADKMEQEPQQLVSLKKVLDDLKEILQIKQNVQTSSTETLESDISFSKGKYELADEGKDVIDNLLNRILADKETYTMENPGKTVNTKIKVVGYTDQLNFGEGTALIEALLEGVEDEAPQEQPERRTFLNQRLSEFRAKTIATHIRQFVSEIGVADSSFKIDTTFIGRGEKVPAGVFPPYPVMDERRRVCKIYIYTTIH